MSTPLSFPPPVLPSFPTRRSSDLSSAVYRHRALLLKDLCVFSASPHIATIPRPNIAARQSSSIENRQLKTDTPPRSEEHTSELQSRGHLVCRLLLEKKKTQETSKQ